MTYSSASLDLAREPRRLVSGVLAAMVALGAIAPLGASVGQAAEKSSKSTTTKSSTGASGGASKLTAARSESSRSKSKLGASANSYNIPQVDFINQQIRQGWTSHELTPAPPATDGEWCRRLFLDVIGRLPTVTELDKFLADKSPDKRKKLVDDLLGEDYIEEYARNWTTIWTNTLIGRTGGTERRTMINRVGMQQALRNGFQRDLTYDKMAYNLISAEGVGKPGEKGYNGYVNFLVGNLADNAVEATARTSQIFLGLQIRCTQCHNHPFNEWKQNQFWEMNAFFRQTKAKKLSDRDDRGELVNSELRNKDFDGEDNRPQEAVLFYELRNGLTKAAYPVFVDGTKLSSDSGYLRDVDRRKELARMIVSSDYFPQAIVNRMWAHFMGYGFTKPIDDMGPHNPPTHPELLSTLGADFKKASFDLKQLIRWIALSEPYALSSHFNDRNKADDPSLGEKPMFSHFYLRQMGAEELYQSLLTATEADKSKGNFEEQEKVKNEWLKQFNTAFGTDEGDEATTFNGTIPQVLMMMNGDLTKNAVGIDKGGFLHNVAVNGKLNNGGKIDYLFEAGLARKPTNSEIAKANELLTLRNGNALAVLQDVWWAILNSNEFILNH